MLKKLQIKTFSPAAVNPYAFLDLSCWKDWIYIDFSEILSSTITCNMDVLGQISQAADYVRD